MGIVATTSLLAVDRPTAGTPHARAKNNNIKIVRLSKVKFHINKGRGTHKVLPNEQAAMMGGGISTI